MEVSRWPDNALSLVAHINSIFNAKGKWTRQSATNLAWPTRESIEMNDLDVYTYKHNRLSKTSYHLCFISELSIVPSPFMRHQPIRCIETYEFPSSLRVLLSRDTPFRGARAIYVHITIFYTLIGSGSLAPVHPLCTIHSAPALQHDSYCRHRATPCLGAH